ncbi:adenylate/guanylate cyclase domain-containing protein [Rhizobiaceae bacterium]|nr:adenylate/guanylate cyclase domain-containing protein [Rhizobiaceae bacterium]
MSSARKTGKLKEAPSPAAGRRKRSAMKDAVWDLWPDIGRSALPTRVIAAIAANDDVSEVLVKLIQFCVFALWGAAYFLTPQPDPTTVSRVPLVIGIYLVFTAATLVVSLVRRTPSWLIYLSIVVDMLLLTYLIWSFHIQYAQPASFSLKAVESMNYFVLIALRSLRFEVRYVMAAGAVAIACWSALLIYVVENDPMDPMVTRDYVTYLTSNHVLVGAEISKMFSIATFTVVLAIAVRRAHSFLVSAISERNAADDLSRFMSVGVAEQIRDADSEIQAGDGVRREAAVLNIDIRGFTALVAARDPAETMELLGLYQAAILPIVHAHSGTVDKFMGDGIMVTFNVVEDDADYCANALRCVDAIMAAQRGWRGAAADLAVNVAVAAGPVVFGAVGLEDRLEYTVIGTAVNLSAKLEKFNKALGTRALATRETYDRALEQGYRPPETLQSANYDEGVDAVPIVVLA